MRYLRKYSIRNKLIIIILLVTTVVTGIGLSFMTYYGIQSLKKEMIQNSLVNARLVADYCITPIIFDDPVGVEEVLEKLQSVPYISSANVYDNRGMLYASYGALQQSRESIEVKKLRESEFNFEAGELHIVQPIFYNDTFYGAVSLHASTENLDRKINNYFLIIGVMVLVLLFISYILAVRLQTVISNPILDLAQVTNRISQERDFSLRVSNEGTDEITVLYDSFNNMLEQIEVHSVERDKAERVNRRLAAILEGTSDIVVVGRREGAFIYMNNAGRKLFGVDMSRDIREMKISDIHPPDSYREIIATALPQAAATGIWAGETQVLGAAGNVIPVSQVILSHKSDSGEVEHYSTIMRDMSEQKRAEEEIRKSEEMLRDLASNLPGIVYQFYAKKNGEFGLYYMSDRGGEIFGMPKDEIGSFEAFANRVHDDDRQAFIESIQEVVSMAAPWEFTGRYVSAAGNLLWFHGLSSRPIMKEDEVIYNGIVLDITQRKQAENELVRIQKYIRSMINSMPSVLIGVDAEGVVTHWNREAEVVTGVSSDMAEGRPLQETSPLLEGELARVKEAIEGRQTITSEKRDVSLRGEPRIADIVIYPLMAGGITGAVIRFDDVTDRVKIEEMIVQSEKMLSVGGLAAGMAHEINNPLAGILQNMQVIQNRFSPDLAKNDAVARDCGTAMGTINAYIAARGIDLMMDSILDSGKRAARIVENMLSFSRKSRADVSTHNIADLLDKTLELASNDYNLKKSYDFRQIEILKEYEETPILVACEASKIQQVVLNILKNGAEALSEKEYVDENPHLIVRAKKDNEYVRIEIEDNGPGMDEATRRRVFEPFFTTKSVGVGTGLGLSVSYFIIKDNHGGNLTVDSKPGIGTTFVISLPIKRGEICFQTA